MSAPAADDGQVTPVASCRLVVDPASWPYAVEHADAIAADWERRRTERPAMFDGVVHLMSSVDVADGRLDARLVATRFKSYLHWREAGFPEAGVRDGFGSAIVVSAEGRVLLGRQRAGNVNSGLAYLPGGFIDNSDVAPDGTIDIEASIVRELAEETGLTVSRARRAPGFLVCQSGPQLAIGVAWHFAEPAAALGDRIRAHLAAEAAPELADALFAGPADELLRLGVPPYARALLRHVFAGGRYPAPA